MEFADKTALIHFRSANSNELLTVRSENGLDHRINEAVEVFISDALEVSRSLSQRNEARANESGALFTEVAFSEVLNDTIDKLLTIRLCNFLIPFNVSYAFDEVSLNRHCAIIKFKTNRAFRYVVDLTLKIRSFNELTSVANDEFVRLTLASLTAVSLSNELVTAVALRTNCQISSNFSCTKSDELSLGVSIKSISHFLFSPLLLFSSRMIS